MLKERAVASLRQQSLLMPAWVKAALLANGRLKLYLTVLQSAAHQAAHAEVPFADWRRELAQVGLQDAVWLHDLAKTAYFSDRILVIPQLDQLLDALAVDLSMMARPVCEGRQSKVQLNLAERRDHWQQRLHVLADGEGLSPQSLSDLTHGNRKGKDSLHLLVMDLHKQLNAISGAIATEELDGAHVWKIEDRDRPLIQAFMRGLNRTAPLKFSHPGLDTAVTRDGARLLIQNDIGTNDVHVLVIEVERRTVSLTYSDLHAGRFGFFRQMLEGIGLDWTVHEPVTSSGLNEGKPYLVGQARLAAADDDALLQALEAVASRIVFVIDWNRARKRLQNFVRKPLAVHLLQSAAQQELGHMAWLLAGGEGLIFTAMQAVDSEAFRVGDRLDDVLGENSASEFLLEVLRISSVMLRHQQPVALVADEVRMLLARVLRQRTFEFDLLAEHAAFCHAIALTLCDAIENAAGSEGAQHNSPVLRAKRWERQADHLLMEARQRGARQNRWLPVVELLEKADDVADALEEAIFIHSMTLIEPLSGLPISVNNDLRQLAYATLAAIQDLVRAIEIARGISEKGDSADGELFLQTLWRMLHAERLCDELTRQARTTIVRTLHASPVGLMLASDLAATIEKASDALLATGHVLRKMVLAKTGMSV
jgi:uncharacterized protein Yka (UPF0111/DUF47 family)